MTSTSETRWLRVLAIIPSSAMAFMDQSILPVALPVIQTEFGSSSALLQWTVNSYLLAIAVFVLMGGKLADRIGHRQAFLLGMVVFAFFSALCSLSPNVEYLIAARAFQGIGAAIMFPAQISLIAMSFPPSARGRATGIVVSMGSAFLVLGPMIGGLLTEWLSWRWIFWINLPIAAVGILLSLFLLPATPARPSKIDLLGFGYFTVFASFLTLIFMQGQDWGWRSDKILGSALLVIITLILLIKREKATAHPFLKLELFKYPVFSAINVSIAITQIILMITVFRTIYTEEILGYTPTQTGLIVSLSSFPVLFFSYIGGVLTDKVSPKLPIVLGYIFIIISFFWLGFAPTPPLVSYFCAQLLFAMGIPFILTPSYSMTMGAIPADQLGNAFGMVSTLRNLAATIGLALIYLFIDLEKNRLIANVGPRMAEIISFSSIHFLLGALMIIAFITAFFFHQKKTLNQK